MDKLWAPWRLEYIQSPEQDKCVFCLPNDVKQDSSLFVVSRGELCYVIMNRFPYSNGHLLISPYRHLSDPEDLTQPEILEIHRLMVQSKKVLMQTCEAQGFNVGWNFGKVAGAGIEAHIHLHIVPRWAGDTNFMPILADTRVIPQHIEQTYSLLVRAFNDEGQKTSCFRSEHP